MAGLSTTTPLPVKTGIIVLLAAFSAVLWIYVPSLLVFRTKFDDRNTRNVMCTAVAAGFLWQVSLDSLNEQLKKGAAAQSVNKARESSSISIEDKGQTTAEALAKSKVTIESKKEAATVATEIVSSLPSAGQNPARASEVANALQTVDTAAVSLNYSDVSKTTMEQIREKLSSNPKLLRQVSESQASEAEQNKLVEMYFQSLLESSKAVSLETTRPIAGKIAQAIRAVESARNFYLRTNKVQAVDDCARTIAKLNTLNVPADFTVQPQL
ncbi:MAG: hypothetical protein DKT66_06535 [Candidatus Melainabacteria bacterium]|nr:MAG: hypothetical protein DKT66_06535 [Candidatus Melainabacteria bacterium]